MSDLELAACAMLAVALVAGVWLALPKPKVVYRCGHDAWYSSPLSGGIRMVFDQEYKCLVSASEYRYCRIPWSPFVCLVCGLVDRSGDEYIARRKREEEAKEAQERALAEEGRRKKAEREAEDRARSAFIRDAIARDEVKQDGI